MPQLSHASESVLNKETTTGSKHPGTPVEELNDSIDTSRDPLADLMEKSAEQAWLAEMNDVFEKLKKECDSRMAVNKKRKLLKRDFLAYILKIQNDNLIISENPISKPTATLKQNVETALKNIASEDRAMIIAGKTSRIRELMLQIFGNAEEMNKAFAVGLVKSNIEKIKEEKITENENTSEVKHSNADRVNLEALKKTIEELDKEVGDKITISKTTKVIKQHFLKDVVSNYEASNPLLLSGNAFVSNKSLKDCVEESAKNHNPEYLPSILKGNFSRVNKLMEKILGDSKTVKTLFAKPEAQKINTDTLTGDAKNKAIFFNLGLYLEKELNSFWPCANKSRKQFKYDFIKQLIADYSASSVSEQPVSLSACYLQLRTSYNSQQLEMLSAGKNSRVHQAITDLIKIEIPQAEQSSAMSNTQ